MKILAFLQNQWFKDPERMRRLLATTFKGNRPYFNKTFLFWSCMTGKRLHSVFGEELCDDIIWEEASPQIGPKSSSAFPAEPAYMLEAINTHKPDVILSFGKIAASGMTEVMGMLAGPPSFHLISGPHPTARHATLWQDLRAMKSQLDQFMQERK